MAEDSEGARGEARVQRDDLAEVIERRRGDVEERWLCRLETQLGDRTVDRTELRNSIDEYLLRTAELLRGQEEEGRGGRGAWAEVTHEHADNRLRLGFDIEQLVREFILLRQVLAQIAEEERVGTAAQVSRLADVIDGAIGEAVKHYAQARDFESRRAEAEHIAFITHELRNPLNTAIFAAARIRREALVAEPARALAVLDASHRRLMRLIDRVLETERLEAGAEEVQPVDMSLGAVIDDALTAGRHAAEAKGIGFHAAVDPSIRIRADPHLTASAVQNLVDNAVKFTDAGSVDVSVEERPNRVAVHVRDTCTGIPAEDLRRIFEPFRRAHKGKEGTGLGLAIARRAVESQGGRSTRSPARRGATSG